MIAKNNPQGVLSLPTLVIAALAFCASSMSGNELRTIKFESDGTPVRNPGKGWVVYIYDNFITRYAEGTDAAGVAHKIDRSKPFDFPGAGMIYFRLSWNHIEKEKGHLDWSLFEPWERYFSEQGFEISYCISVSEDSEQYATPRWVFNQGAALRLFHNTPELISRHPDSCPKAEPVYEDPMFLSCLGSFLAAFNKRIQAMDNVPFIDVGSLGVWGEGHTLFSTKVPISREAYIKNLELHMKQFPNIFLLINDDYDMYGDKVVQWAKEINEQRIKEGLAPYFGFRDDSICVQPKPLCALPKSQQMAADFWSYAPVVVETDHYQQAKDRGSWDSAEVARLVKEVYHASYVSIHHWPDDFLKREPELVRDLANTMGYWIHLAGAKIPNSVRRGQTTEVELSWTNRGSAPLYRQYAIAFALTEVATDKIVWTQADTKYDLRTWMPEKTTETKHGLALPETLRPGKYRLLLGLSKDAVNIKPAIALPMKGRDKNRWHSLAEIAVE